MSLIEDLDKLHITLKTIALNVFLMPFWYISIFLFHRDFYKTSDNILIFVFCFAFSVISTLVFSVMQYKAEKEVNNHSDDVLYYFALMTRSVILLSVWLSLMIFTIYSLSFITGYKIHFYYFIVIYFLPIFFIIAMYLFETSVKELKVLIQKRIHK